MLYGLQSLRPNYFIAFYALWRGADQHTKRPSLFVRDCGALNAVVRLSVDFIGDGIASQDRL